MNPIILALDFNSLSDADDMISKVRNYIGMIKIGPELFSAYGEKALELGLKHYIPIFLDLKLHDVPNTVANTVKVIVDKFSEQYKIKFLTVHAFGGKEMLKAAVGEARGSDLSIAAVTLLTSLNWEDLSDFGFRDRREGIKTIDLGKLAKESGVNTFVAAPNQIHLMRKNLDDGVFRATLVTPGIRAEGAPEDDQKRTKSVSFAIRNGTDWVVIGRPITQSPDPESAARLLCDQIDKARK